MMTLFCAWSLEVWTASDRRASVGGIHKKGLSPGTIASRAALCDSTGPVYRPGAPASRAEAAVCTGRVAPTVATSVSPNRFL